MGNSLNANATGTTGLGWAVANSRAVETFGFDSTLRAMVLLGDVEPWSARGLLRLHLDNQTSLRKQSPLRYVHVADGLAMFNREASTLDGRVCRRAFLRAARAALLAQNIPGVGGYSDEALLSEVFDSLDFDGAEKLSKGEWACGLLFFEGSAEEKVRAVFELLDRNGNGALDRAELQEYLTPFMKAVTPSRAASLRPLLLRQAAEDIFAEIDRSADGRISSMEMLRWLRAGNDVLERLCSLIEQSVYQVWVEGQLVAGAAGAGLAPESVERAALSLLDRARRVVELEVYKDRASPLVGRTAGPAASGRAPAPDSAPSLLEQARALLERKASRLQREADIFVSSKF